MERLRRRAAGAHGAVAATRVAAIPDEAALALAALSMSVVGQESCQLRLTSPHKYSMVEVAMFAASLISARREHGSRECSGRAPRDDLFLFRSLLGRGHGSVIPFR